MAEDEKKKENDRKDVHFQEVEPERAPLTQEMIDWLWEHPEWRAEIARKMREDKG